ncbi:hypothetical protein F0562_035428 [Nyssa sinensis]|uniref:PGG domain-containing protein n=1 Tax=Nyssa sinensis TaxID=561372 RepID=A0A5J5A9Q5_9ASTE|nr:hypothetical protein F0562_035428 [Nyssa sinensis]
MGIKGQQTVFSVVSHRSQMDPVLYRAAVEGNIAELEQKQDQLKVQVTPNKNTVLHVAAQFHNNSNCVKEILALQSLLLCMVNSNRETPLHIAAREGQYDIVQALIECANAASEELESGIGLAKEMLRMTNEDGDTALHEAVRNNHLPVVQLLTKEDLEFSHPTNNAEESPLYLAVEREYCSIAAEILTTCRSPFHDGPDGRTALHAAAIWDCEVCTKKLYDWKPSLTKEADKNGWTPLHYAARLGKQLRVRQLLDLDKSVAYLNSAEEDERKTALHVATSHGHVGVMKEILSHCPDCWEMLNSKGQNILHIAVESEKEKPVEFIFKSSWHIRLINQKDVGGNTPLHLYATSMTIMPCRLWDPRVDKMAFNKENLTALDLISSSDRLIGIEGMIEEQLTTSSVHGLRNVVLNDNAAVAKIRKARGQIKKKKNEICQILKEEVNSNLIVATLIVTVTFAAGFTVPGGYDDNEGPNHGMAILTREAAFQTFVVTNVIAMISATCAVFLYFIASSYVNDLVKFNIRAQSARLLIIIAMVAMVIAFITGIYAVVANFSGLAIATCVIGCSSFLLFYFLLKRRLNDVLSIGVH